MKRGRFPLLACIIAGVLTAAACTSPEGLGRNDTTVPTASSSHHTASHYTTATAPLLSASQEPATTSATPALHWPAASEEELAAYFSDCSASTVLFFNGTRELVYNEALAETRQSPYSTFKILNSLIALEEGIITPTDSTRPWDGVERKRKEWNEDQDLTSAMKHSCLWYYQRLAREVGRESMQRHLDAVGYGNGDISGGIDLFWLGSSLEISPREQVDFLEKLVADELPFSTEHTGFVKSLLRQENTPFPLYGKTGSSGSRQGWFVGYFTQREQTIFFATYIQGDDVSGAMAREKSIRMIQDFFL